MKKLIPNEKVLENFVVEKTYEEIFWSPCFCKSECECQFTPSHPSASEGVGSYFRLPEEVGYYYLNGRKYNALLTYEPTDLPSFWYSRFPMYLRQVLIVFDDDEASDE